MFRLKCATGSRRGRACGFLMMLFGLVLMMLTVPGWAWAGLLCGVLILIGFILWQCGG